MEAQEFVWSDAWLLLSLIYARTPSTRERVQQVGDFINHAFFTDEELEGGIARLIAAGYATEVEALLAPTSLLLDWYQPVGPATRRSVSADLKRVERFLGIR